MSNAPNPNDPKEPDFSNVKSGSSSTAQEQENVDFSNVQSGSSSTAESTGEQTYTVQKGDTLSHIAKQFYGKSGAWHQIFEANRDQLDNPDLIKPGQVLKIPPKAD